MILPQRRMSAFGPGDESGPDFTESGKRTGLYVRIRHANTATANFLARTSNQSRALPPRPSDFLTVKRRLLSVLRRGFFSLVRAINHALLHASRLTGNPHVVSRYTDFCSTIFLA